MEDVNMSTFTSKTVAGDDFMMTSTTGQCKLHPSKNPVPCSRLAARISDLGARIVRRWEDPSEGTATNSRSSKSDGQGETRSRSSGKRLPQVPQVTVKGCDALCLSLGTQA